MEKKNDDVEGKYMVVSQVRVGHKREFQFALQSQNELPGSLTRLRTRNPTQAQTQTHPQKKSKTKTKKSSVAENDVDDEECPESDVLDDVATTTSSSSEDGVESVRRETGDDVDGGVEDGEWMVLEKKKKGVPKRLDELLDTGLFEGLNVRYIRFKSDPKKKVLRGVIKGTDILCFCADCKGTRVVKPSQFEIHAGSGNKRPADYMVLDNGEYLRGILNACKDVQLKYVGNTIRNAISSLTKKKFLLCRNCQVPIREAGNGSGKMLLLCSSCAVDDASPMTPSAAAEPIKRSVIPISSLKFKVSSAASKSCSSSTKSQGKITRKDMGLHKLIFEEDILPDGTELGYYSKGKKVVSGMKMGYAIYCNHCEKMVSPSRFESCAECSYRRKPYDHIYTSDGTSLHSISLAARKCKVSKDKNDDLCSICQGVGNLLCCDCCPRAFHIKCIVLPSVMPEKWFCRHCENLFQKERFAERDPNAVAAGRVPGIDPMEQITSCCIRVVNMRDVQDTGCSLCRKQDYCTSEFGPRTMIICDQCEKEYHVNCMKDNNMQDLKELPEGEWFCCSDCGKINSELKELIEHGEQQLPDDMVNVINKKLAEEGSTGNAPDIRWRVLHGKQSSLDEIRQLLSKAVSVFHEQFSPICYGESTQDLIPHMVYGRNMKESELGGMYCAVLTVNSSIVSAAVFRVFSKEVAEIPLVATTKDCVGRGYFQCLYSCIEKQLNDLGVKNLLLPAAEETISMWLNRFYFEAIPIQELDQLLSDYALLKFGGTSMLRKLLTGSRS